MIYLLWTSTLVAESRCHFEIVPPQLPLSTVVKRAFIKRVVSMPAISADKTRNAHRREHPQDLVDCLQLLVVFSTFQTGWISDPGMG